MPNVPLAYVSVYRRMSDIFHTLAYASTIRNSVTGPLVMIFTMPRCLASCLACLAALQFLLPHIERSVTE
jgi:hypothetical protein